MRLTVLWEPLELHWDLLRFFHHQMVTYHKPNAMDKGIIPKGKYPVFLLPTMSTPRRGGLKQQLFMRRLPTECLLLSNSCNLIEFAKAKCFCYLEDFRTVTFAIPFAKVKSCFNGLAWPPRNAQRQGWSVPHDWISISFSIFYMGVYSSIHINWTPTNHSKFINHRQVTPLLWHPRTSRMGWSAVDIR